MNVNLFLIRLMIKKLAAFEISNGLYRTHLRYFKSSPLGRMKHLGIKHRVFSINCRPNASSLHHMNINLFLMRLMIKRLAAF
jgi:hypothetical protein